MKKLLLSILLTFLPLLASAESVEIDGIFYLLNDRDKLATVTTAPNNYHGNVEIPEIVNYGGTTYIVKFIGSKAFANSGDLTSITIPNSVKNIGSSAFSGCDNLNRIILLFSQPFSINDNTFSNYSYLNANLIVRPGTMDLYKPLSGWKNFAKIETELTEGFYHIQILARAGI